METLDSITALWTGSDIYQFFIDLYAYVIIKVTYIRFYFMYESIKLSYQIAQSIISQLNITNEIQSLLSLLPDTTVQQLNFFNVIEGINILLSAAATRFVMSFRS